MVGEMKVRYGLSESAVGGLASCEFVLPAVSDQSSERQRTEILAKFLACRLRYCPDCSSSESAYLRCSRGRSYLKSAGKCEIERLHGRSLLSIHPRFFVGSGARSGYRLRRVWVGPEGGAHSFVAAQIDVQSHLSRFFGLIADFQPAQRLFSLLLAVDVLHPFEDGNGRLMRGLSCAFAVTYQCSFFAFVAVYAKVMQDDFVHALEMAADGVPGELLNFNLNVVRAYQQALAEPNGLKGWLDEFSARWQVGRCAEIGGAI